MARTPRKVIQCDKDGKAIASFPSAKAASLSFGSPYPNAIHKAIRYGMTAFGFRWRYEGEDCSKPIKKTPGKRRPIISINIDNQERLFESLSNASKDLGIGISAIEHALLTGGQVKGYRFRYADADAVTPAKQNPLTRPIEVIDEVGQVVATYPSAKEASKALGVSLSMVYWCTAHKKKQRRCKGLHLRYKSM